MFDCVVAGAGPAGLAVSAALSDHDVDHVVLERDRVGQSWRTQRWASMRLNNPGWMNPMLSLQEPDTYLTAAEVVERLDRLAASRPVREQIDVAALRPTLGGWLLHTSEGAIRARTVVVATGGENIPRTPALAQALPEPVMQLHAAHYRAPEQLPSGGVLVVGSAQSGYQIAEELLASGRRVVLATSPVGRAPARHRGRDTVAWLVEYGFFDQSPQDLADPATVQRPQPLLAPGGRSASLHILARAGATLTGRLITVVGTRLSFDHTLAANLAIADRYAADIRTLLDRTIPPEALTVRIEPDDADSPVPVDPLRSLDLRSEHISAVIWATGYTGDFSWLPGSLLDATGLPRHAGTTAPIPGLWYVGLRWLTRRSSGNFLGFPIDAAEIAPAVRSYLERLSRAAG
jgi:putative flavoprotein involved in K+ transport